MERRNLMISGLVTAAALPLGARRLSDAQKLTAGQIAKRFESAVVRV